MPSDAFSEAIEDVGRRDHRQAGAERRAVDGDDDRLGALADRMEALARPARMRGQVARALDDLRLGP